MRAVLLGLCLFPLLACGTDSDQAADPDVPGRAANPEGIPYPTENVGGVVGMTVPNFTMTGVLSAATAGSLATVSLADYYDPEGLRYDLLHLVVMQTSSIECHNMATQLGALAAWHAEKRVAVVQIALGGNQGNNTPTLAEVGEWAVSHKLESPVLIDARARRMRPYWRFYLLPTHITINPRNMQVLNFEAQRILNVQAYEMQFLPKDLPTADPPPDATEI